MTRVWTRPVASRFRRGFTLIETLAALALCGMLMSVVFSAIHLSERTRIAGERQVGKSMLAWGLVEDISSDLQNAVAPAVWQTATADSSMEMFEVGINERLLDVREQLLDLTVPSSIEPMGFVGEPHTLVVQVAGDNGRFDHASGGTQETPDCGGVKERCVAYVINNRTSIPLTLERERGRPKTRTWLSRGESGLVRIERPAWHLPGLPIQGVGVSNERVTLVSSQVTAIAFRYFDGLAWQDRWDSHLKQRLPTAVEVTASFVDFKQPRTFVVQLPCCGGGR